MPMDAMPSTTPVAAQGQGQVAWADKPRLVRWAHLCTLLGFVVIGLSLVGIVLASIAKRNGEFGAAKALRNAVAMTLFLALLFLAVVAIASFL